MSWRVITALLFLYVMVVLLSGVMTEAYYGDNATTIVSLIIRPQTPSYTNPVGGISSTFSVTSAWIGAFFQALFLDFPIFDGPYQIVRILILTTAMGVLAYQVISGIKPG